MSRAEEFSRQCRLEKNNITSVAWIPEKFAEPGKTLAIKRNGEWEDDWTVTAVYERLETRLIQNQSHNAADIWKATSGSCPRGNK